MSITPLGLTPASPPAAGMQSATQVSARSETGQVSVTFAPGNNSAGPLDRVGEGMVNKLKQFEARRTDSAQAMSHIHPGPANPVDVAKSELLSGPASKSLSADSRGMSATGTGTDDAVAAMTRSFDYAIETQLIVKTGSQLSSSASSLMRGQ